MSSKPRRGTVRWSQQRCTSSSNTTAALLLTSLTVFLSNLLSSAHGNPLHPFSTSLALGRNLRHLPCVVRSSGAEGICMFAIDCFKANGTHLGVCIDKIFFGSCCQVHDDSLLFNHEITDNSIDHNSHYHFTPAVVDTNAKAPLTDTRLPTTTAPKNGTVNYELVSSSSTTTHRTTAKVNRRNTTSSTTTTKVQLKDDLHTSTEYQEFSTFQYVQSSKHPGESSTEANRRTTTTKYSEKTTTRRIPPRNTTKPYKTRRPTPSRNSTRRPTVQTTTPKAIITSIPEVRQNSTSWSSVTRRPTTTADTTSSSSRKPTTASSTTVRRTTVISRRPTTTPTQSSEEFTLLASTTKKSTLSASVLPMTRPTIRRKPITTTSTTTTTVEPETTKAPRPRPRPTSEIVTVPATSLEHLLDDLVTTVDETSSSEISTTDKTSSTYPVTTVKITEATTPTTTPTTTTTMSTTAKPTTTTTTTSTTKTTKTTTPATTTTTTTPATTTTTTTTPATTTTTSTTPAIMTTTTTTPATTTTTTTTTTEKPTTTTTTSTTSTTTTPKTTTASGRITPPADIDYLPETSQTDNLLDETTAGVGFVTWSSIGDIPNEKITPQQAPTGPTTSNSWILIHTLTPEEVLGTGSNQSNNHSSSTQPSSTDMLIDIALPTLSQDIILPALDALLPEAAYIYTIHDETNQTLPGEFMSHSQLASPSSTEDTSLSSTTTVEEPSTTSSSTSTTTTTPATTTTSTTTTTMSSTTTVSTSSTTETVREAVSSSTTGTTITPTTSTTEAPATTTTEAIKTTTTPEPTTTTPASSTSELTTTVTRTTATEPISSSTVTDTTTPQITSTLTQLQSSSTVQTSTLPPSTATTEQETSPATSTMAPEILIEILAPTTTSPKEPSTTQAATVEPSTVEPVTDITTEEGSSEEGSGSEEESGEEESSSYESYESTPEPSSSTLPSSAEVDRYANTTITFAPETSTSPESTTIGSSTTLNITSSLQSIASMFNISTSTGMPVRFPEDNSTIGAGGSTSSSSGSSTTTKDGITISPDFITTSTVPSLEGIDYRAVCGKRMFPEPRIVGGTKAAFGRWPWQISLRQWRTSTYLHKCGAALLNENWAITAAHCVDNVPPSDLLLRLGEYDLALEEEPYGYQERRVQIVASHPQFDPRTFEYDLALLRFYEPVIFQPNIIPVCVPEGDENFIGRTAFVTGWGRLYEDGPLPSVLQEVTVPVIENKICETMYRSAGYIEHIPHIFICAGWKKGGYDSCEGDSGGPMVIQRPDKRFLLAGVISWGIGCAEPNQPGVYTRISEFRDWINQILQF